MASRAPHVSILPALLVCGGIVALVIVARFESSWPLHPPPCSFRTMTGIPCMACGGTRSFIALAHGDWLAALRFNPLVFVSVVACAGWLVTRVITRKPVRIHTKLTVMIIVFAILANWVWLIKTLPG